MQTCLVTSSVSGIQLIRQRISSKSFWIREVNNESQTPFEKRNIAEKNDGV